MMLFPDQVTAAVDKENSRSAKEWQKFPKSWSEMTNQEKCDAEILASQQTVRVSALLKKIGAK